MPPAPVSRRAFLAGGAGLALGAAAAATAPQALGALVTAKNRALSALSVSNDLYASTTPQRVAFVIYRGPKPASFGDAQVAFGEPGSKQVAASKLLETNLYTDGLPRGRGMYVTEGLFPTAGIYPGVVVTEDRKVPFAVQVKPAPEAPAPGMPASRAPSPTTSDRLGVNPICTRRPACPLHDVSLSDVIGSGAPVAVMFATPALCQTMYCGPVLDELLDVMAPYQQEGVRMVHVEIYTSNRGATKAPTVEAWNLPYEPWFFTIDGAGIIRDRLDSAFATNEVAAALDRLVA